MKHKFQIRLIIDHHIIQNSVEYSPLNNMAVSVQRGTKPNKGASAAEIHIARTIKFAERKSQARYRYIARKRSIARLRNAWDIKNHFFRRQLSARDFPGKRTKTGLIRYADFIGKRPD